jgi:hypothetical protein
MPGMIAEYAKVCFVEVHGNAIKKNCRKEIYI